MWEKLREGVIAPAAIVGADAAISSDAGQDLIKKGKRALEDKEQEFQDYKYTQTKAAKKLARVAEDDKAARTDKYSGIWHKIKRKGQNLVDDSNSGKLKRGAEDVYDDAKGLARKGIKATTRAVEDTTDYVKHMAPKAGIALRRTLEDHPGKIVLLAAGAVAAGLGGVALARKLRKMKQQKEENAQD